MTSATDKLTIELLCEMLEEQGVSCHTHYLHAFWWVRDKLYEAADNLDGTLTVGRLTPEQAIAATLGSKTCIVIHDLVTHDFRCSNCGKQIGVVRNCEMYETCDGQQAWKSLDHEVCDIPNFCPNCGAKVVK